LNPAPRRGEHTRAVLRDVAGIDDAEIDALAAAGAFGDVEV
jgi:crotonobetainyl-CoA:carnitine CoA-transferase CaiB-like acyl-CoA transferase